MKSAFPIPPLPIDEMMQTLESVEDDLALHLQPLREELITAGARVEMLSPGGAGQEHDPCRPHRRARGRATV
jgi:hypothetical protein